LIQEIFKKVEKLSTFPCMGRTVPDQSNEKIHEILHKNYRIIYEIKDDHIEILIVIHGSRILRIHSKKRGTTEMCCHLLILPL